MRTKIPSNEIYEKRGVYGDVDQFTCVTPDRLEKMVDYVRDLKNPPKNVLDIGCGTGYFAHLIGSTYPKAKVYGVDISNTALLIGRKKFKNVNFTKADAEVELPFNDDKFDLVISGEHIEHLKDVDRYLEEINRVTKRGGILILTTPNLASWMNRILLLFGRQPFFLEPSLRKTLPIFQIGGYIFPEGLDSPPSGHLRLFTLDTLKKLLRFYGFETTEVQGFMILRKLFLKQIDKFFTRIPMLAFGVIVRAEKASNL